MGSLLLYQLNSAKINPIVGTVSGQVIKEIDCHITGHYYVDTYMSISCTFSNLKEGKGRELEA